MSPKECHKWTESMDNGGKQGNQTKTTEGEHVVHVQPLLQTLPTSCGPNLAGACPTPAPPGPHTCVKAQGSTVGCLLAMLCPLHPRPQPGRPSAQGSLR